MCVRIKKKIRKIKSSSGKTLKGSSRNLEACDNKSSSFFFVILYKVMNHNIFPTNHVVTYERRLGLAKSWQTNVKRR